jgi:hypothetical protein
MPLPPSDIGQRLFLSGISDSVRQQHRQALFAVTRKHLTDVAERFVSNFIIGLYLVNLPR